MGVCEVLSIHGYYAWVLIEMLSGEHIPTTYKLELLELAE